MANLASILKDEIARVSRREIKKATDPLRKATTTHRRDIAALKRDLAQANRVIATLSKHVGKQRPVLVEESTDGARIRISPNGIKTLRSKLGLSAEQFGSLVEVSGQSVYLWERGKTSPRAPQLAKLASLRTMGKREVAGLLADASSKPSAPKKSAKTAKRVSKRVSDKRASRVGKAKPRRKGG